ncbi:MAG: SDR family oxidoreductase [Woeseiaceae bacterium]|nr:SDR family oxidoreductase [Woeseiaceae bacterium]
MNRRHFLQAATAAAMTPPIAGCGGPELVPAPDVPRSQFNEDSTAEQVTRGMDLKGKIAVVTGCNSGIGFETMRVLALRGCYVIGTGRTLEKAEAACSRVKGITTPIQLELSDFDSVVNCAEEIRKMNSPIDILVCNAGMRGAERETVYGLEKHFVVNHLGHFIFVNRLLDRLFFAWQGRVVIVGSRAAYRSAPQEGIKFSDLQFVHDYSAGRAYAHSKLANVLYSYELARLLKGTRITSNSLHPGVINTNIARNVSPILRNAFGLLTRVRGKTIEQGAATSCFVATSPLLGNISGEYFEDCNAVRVIGDNHMHNRDMASHLWVVSEELTRDYLVEHQRPDWSEFENGLRRPRAN